MFKSNLPRVFYLCVTRFSDSDLVSDRSDFLVTLKTMSASADRKQLEHETNTAVDNAIGLQVEQIKHVIRHFSQPQNSVAQQLDTIFNNFIEGLSPDLILREGQHAEKTHKINWKSTRFLAKLENEIRAILHNPELDYARALVTSTEDHVHFLQAMEKASRKASRNLETKYSTCPPPPLSHPSLSQWRVCSCAVPPPDHVCCVCLCAQGTFGQPMPFGTLQRN